MENTKPYLIFPGTLEEMEVFINKAVENALTKMKDENAIEDLMSFTEASKRFNVSKVTLHAWCRKGRLTKLKPEGSSLSKLDPAEVRKAFREIMPYQKIKI